MNIDERMERDPQTELAATLTDPAAQSLTDFLASSLKPSAQQLVRTVDPLMVSGQEKHDWVYSALLELVPLLHASVKETRPIPDEVIASVLDNVIEGAVSWVRGVL